MKQKDIIGWIGVLLIVTAFILTTLELINAKHIMYGALNFIGALGIIVSSYAKRDFQPVILNVVWLIVASIGITKSLL